MKETLKKLAIRFGLISVEGEVGKVLLAIDGLKVLAEALSSLKKNKTQELSTLEREVKDLSDKEEKMINLYRAINQLMEK